MGNLNFHIFMIIHQRLYRAIAGIGAYENNQLMTMPKRIGLREAIISFKPLLKRRDGSIFISISL